MILTIEMGDTSGDGHCISDAYNIETNTDRGSILRAISKAKEEFPFLRSLCSDYEDRNIRTKDYLTLKTAGIDVLKYGFYPDEKVQYLGEEGYFRMYMALIAKYIPSFTYKVIEGEIIDLGGYGLFS